MAASHKLIAVGRGVVHVVLTAEKRLHPVPGSPVDQRLVLSGIPLAFVADFSNVGSKRLATAPS